MTERLTEEKRRFNERGRLNGEDIDFLAQMTETLGLKECSLIQMLYDSEAVAWDEVERLTTENDEKDATIEEEHLNAQDWEDEYMSLKRRFDELDKSALETYELLKDSSTQAVSLRKALEEAKDEILEGKPFDAISVIESALGEGDKE